MVKILRFLSSNADSASTIFLSSSLVSAELFSSLARKCQSKEGRRKFLRTVQVGKALKFLGVYIWIYLPLLNS